MPAARRGLRVMRLWLALLCVLLHPTAVQAWEGLVIKIVDGDTVVLAPHGAPHGDISVRLYGVDAPELSQPAGDDARAALARLVQCGEAVSVVPLAEDRYSRVIGLLVRDGQILNYELVRQGHAWVYTPYCKARFCGQWQSAEQAARQARKGLWGAASPIPPWDWRKKKEKSCPD